MPRITLYVLFATFFSIVGIGTVAAEMVVIASTAAEIKGGQVVKDGATLNVPDGASVTLVSSDGAALTINGPFTGVPGGKKAGSGGDNSLVSSLSGLLSSTGKKTAALGVMRAGATKDPDDPWTVNTERSGKQCVRAGVPAVLWRSNAGKKATLKIRNMKSKERTTTEWPSGAEKLKWPEGSAVSDGEQYIIRKKGDKTAKKITLFVVPSDLPSDAHMAIWMAENGCTMQAKVLLNTIR
ncbi:MAG: hypothetical protein HN403_01705 [Rhodospirillales bacterium]|jgi:hypothetical protein|nr:hypothetical protein [Rhodospirillales bacterium]